MKNGISILILFFFHSYIASSQVPQIALYRPSNNTTQIFTDLPAAYNAAINDDIIYLPGGIYSFPGDSIAKKLHIIGAGFSQDSTQTTGQTIISLTLGSLSIKFGGTGTILEGFRLRFYNQGMNNFDTGDLFNGNQIVVKNCKVRNCSGQSNCNTPHFLYQKVQLLS